MVRWPHHGAHIALLCWLVMTAWMAVARIDRQAAPVITFHDHDLALYQNAMVLSGARSADGLPVAELEPLGVGSVDAQDMLSAVLANSPNHTQSYKNTVSLHHFLSALWAVLVGVSPWSIRQGTVLVGVLLGVALAGAGRAVAGHRSAAVMAAVLGLSLPAFHTGMVVGVPILGNALGVALPLWLLLRCDGGARWLWAMAAGAAVAIAPRFGESAGDGIAVLLGLVGPVGLTAGLMMGRLFVVGQRLRGLLGLAGLSGGVWVASLLLDRWWLRVHLEEYVLGEADVSAGVGQVDAQAFAYADALVWSLAGPVVCAVMALGMVVAVSRSRQSLAWLWPASSAAGVVSALILSTKAQDLYFVPALPGLVIWAVAGLRHAPLRWLWVVLVGGIGVAQVHQDLPAFAQLRCNPAVSFLVTADARVCGTWPQTPPMFQWVTSWREKPYFRLVQREEMAHWAREGAGADWLTGLPTGALVVLQRPPGFGGEADVLQMIWQASRLDVDVRMYRGPMVNAALREALQEHSGRTWVVTLRSEMVEGRDFSPQSLDVRLGPGELLDDQPLWRIYSLDP